MPSPVARAPIVVPSITPLAMSPKEEAEEVKDIVSNAVPSIVPLSMASDLQLQANAVDIQTIAERSLTPRTASSAASSLEGRTSLQDLEAQARLAEVLLEGPEATKARIEKDPSFDFPQLMQEASRAVEGKQKFIEDHVIRKHLKEIEKHRENKDLLYKVQAKLIAHKDNAPITPEMKELFQQLKERGISLWESEKEVLSADDKKELRQLVTSRIEQETSEQNVHLMAHIQPAIQASSTLTAMWKSVLEDYKKQLAAANKLAGRGG